MFLRVWFHLSINPFPSGWYGAEKCGKAPKIFKNSCVKLDVKFVALSINITSGIPVLLNISSSATHVLLAVSDWSGIASRHLECWSIKQKIEADPQVYVETPLHPETLTVWCALWAGGIIGPYFFKSDEGHDVTVNGDRYRAMITNFFIPELNNHDVQELWFQQDSATCYTARATID
ncbi:putative transposable element [Trichonephila clavipes]|nr:putative transposable element [Trichonephila clavipes]